MQIRVCPECYKAFYMAVYDDCVICPYCGHLFCERRIQERTRKQEPISFSLNGSHTLCVTTDYSDDGAGIVYKGGFVEPDTIVAVCMGYGARRNAKTVWSKKVSRSIVSAGLRLL